MATIDRATAVGLRKVHDTFLLYGTPSAPYWFLGLEEGYERPDDGSSVDDLCASLHRKAQRFRDSDGLSLRDLAGGNSKYLPAIERGGADGVSDVSYQCTWGGYIKLLLSAECARAGRPASWGLEDVKRYQKYRLGSLDGSGERGSDALPGSCLMELFDLPWNRGRGKWPYAKLSVREGLEYLATPARYRRYVLKGRVERLLGLVQRHGPRFLLCFGAECRYALRGELRGSTETIVPIEVRGKRHEIVVLERDGTTVVFARHPAARGQTDEYWIALGQALAERFPVSATKRAA